MCFFKNPKNTLKTYQMLINTQIFLKTYWGLILRWLVVQPSMLKIVSMGQNDRKWHDLSPNHLRDLQNHKRKMNWKWSSDPLYSAPTSFWLIFQTRNFVKIALLDNFDVLDPFLESKSKSMFILIVKIVFQNLTLFYVVNWAFEV